MSKPTLVIGDSHGHYDRLVELLKQEGVVDKDTEKRTNRNVRVVHVGDLGHFGRTGSPTGDKLCYEAADDFFDTLLWGNHDRALVDTWHAFAGIQNPGPYIVEIMNDLIKKGKLVFATSASGYLITHAGVASGFEFMFGNKDVDEIARELNHPTMRDSAVVNWIGASRGGRRTYGGILWRDWHSETLANFPQIMGHTSLGVLHKGRDVTHEWRDEKGNFNIDVGTAHNGRLRGLWLPSLNLVEVKLENSPYHTLVPSKT